MHHRSILTDEQVVDLVRTKNQELYGEIIRRYETKLTHYLRKFIHSQDELKDVLQDVFIKAFRNLYDFDVDKKFSAWIYRIAHNEALNYLKKYHRSSISLDEVDWSLLEDKKDLNRETDHQFFKNQVEKGIALVKEKYRDPLILYLFEEKSYEEIGDILHLPTSTVGIRIMRGKKLLQQFLTQEIYGKK
ncbi:MAG: RNA polymerase sigma factor [Candidatus Magasanikbacteria bacterium]|nr:RNA polymerase sigma factor [Candidatus Magasanikbacteria bacterium]